MACEQMQPGRATQMRVLHIGKFFAPFAGGIENFMLDLLRAGNAEGVAQACLVHAAPGQSRQSADDDFDFIEHFERVPTVAQISYAPVSRGFRRAMERIVAEFRPDVLHLHVPNTSAFWALLGGAARRIPWVVHWHSDVVGPGLDTKLKLLYPFYRPFEQALLKRADVVIATSPPYLDSSRALQPWREKCRVIPLGLAPDRVEVAGPRGSCAAAGESGADWAGDGRFRVLGVGRLARYKGFETLIRAAAGTEAVQLIIAGAGEQRARLERLVPAHASGRIRLVGGVDDATRNRLMAECDLFCLPSVNRAEAFGLSLVEAMAAGKAQLATRVAGSGMGWVVEEGRTGWMVRPGDAQGLATVLSRLARERALVAAAGKCSRGRFEARFRIDAVAREVVEVYRALLPSR